MEKKTDIQLSCYVADLPRLDGFLAQCFGVSRSVVKQWIVDGNVCVNGQVVQKPAVKIREQDTLACVWVDIVSNVEMGDIEYVPNQYVKSKEWQVPIVYEDDAILVVNKPYGLIVHGAESVTQVTLVDILIASGVGLAMEGHRQGVVHRLDQFTEGVMVLAKTDSACSALQDQFKERLVSKRYYAVLQGVLVSDQGEICRPIGRDISVRARRSCHHMVSGTEKEAITKYKVLQQYTNITVVDVELITGRTHQIRVHFAALNTPVLGDSLYSNQSKKPEGYYLQSYYLSFVHPVTQKDVLFKVPVSRRLKKYAKGE
jgi:23S rRNA pseudouridine1911/1915/1917 synthase